MNAVSTAKNRWGDPPLVVQGRLSWPAVCAILLAIAAVSYALLGILFAGAEGQWRPLAALVALLLTLLQFTITPVVFVLSYVALCLCRPGGVRSGRGLAWAALGLVYFAFVFRIAISPDLIPWPGLIIRGLLIAGVAHLLMFAAESRFARHAVAALFIGGLFLSLLFPWIAHSREESRRLLCQDRLRQLALGMHTVESFDAKNQLPAATPPSGDEPQSALSPLIRQWLSESTESTWTPPPPGAASAPSGQAP